MRAYTGPERAPSRSPVGPRSAKQLARARASLTDARAPWTRACVSRRAARWRRCRGLASVGNASVDDKRDRTRSEHARASPTDASVSDARVRVRLTRVRVRLTRVRVRLTRVRVRLTRVRVRSTDARASRGDARAVRTGVRVGQADGALRPVGRPVSAAGASFAPFPPPVPEADAPLRRLTDSGH